MTSVPPQDQEFKTDDPTHFPADPHAELAVLGAILLDPPLIESVGDLLVPRDFYHGPHRDLFDRMLKLWAAGEPLDPILISDRDNELYAICQDAVNLLPTSLYGMPYARRVKQLAQKRHYANVANTLIGYAMNGKTPEDIADFLIAEVEAQQAVSVYNPYSPWRQQGITAAEAARTEIAERAYVVQDLIREKSLSVFYGNPGEFKSALLMDLALCVACGRPWLERLPVAGNDQPEFATRPARVLWLNYDQGHDDVIERLGAMARAYGDGENVTAISHSSPPAILENERQARSLGEMCAFERYGVVIVDSLLDVRGKADLQEASMGDVLRLWRLVAEAGNLAVIVIAHSTKLTQDLYGSQFIKAKLDHLYHVTRPAGTDVAIVESQKQRSFGATGKLYARWTWQHLDGTRTLRTARFYGDATEKRTAHPNNTTQAAILDVLMGSPGRGFNAAQLAEILNEDRDADDQISPHSIRRAGDRLAENDRNVTKSKTDEGIIYHYGDLSHAPNGG